MNLVSDYFLNGASGSAGNAETYGSGKYSGINKKNQGTIKPDILVIQLNETVLRNIGPC